MQTPNSKKPRTQKKESMEPTSHRRFSYNEKLHCDWLQHPTEEELRLYHKVAELSGLLGDLLFHEGTFTSSLIRDPKSGKFIAGIPDRFFYDTTSRTKRTARPSPR